jgi:hypothetical protein
MRFLADQDVYAITISYLKGIGHEVISASQLGLAQATDSQLLRVTLDMNRLPHRGPRRLHDGLR